MRLGASLVRGSIAFGVAVIAGILATVFASFLYALLLCPPELCGIDSDSTRLGALFILYGFAGFFVAILAIVPFLLIFMGLERINAVAPLPCALLGALFGLGLLAIGVPLKNVPPDTPPWDVFMANLTSPFGVGAIVIGALCGLDVWAVDERLRQD